MSFPIDDKEVDHALADAFGPPPKADFDKWRKQHPQAVASLDPQRMVALSKRRRMMSHAVGILTAAAVLVSVYFGLSYLTSAPDAGGAYADVVAACKQMEDANTVTWKATGYQRVF